MDMEFSITKMDHVIRECTIKIKKMVKEKCIIHKEWKFYKVDG